MVLNLPPKATLELLKALVGRKVDVSMTEVGCLSIWLCEYLFVCFFHLLVGSVQSSPGQISMVWQQMVSS